MSEIEVSLQDFIKSTTIGMNDKACFSQTINKIINFYRSRDQINSYFVNDMDLYGDTIGLDLSTDDKEVFYSYGIRLLSYNAISKVDRKYILIIPRKESLSDYKSNKFEEEYNNAILDAKKSLPENLPADTDVGFADDNKLISYKDFDTRIKLVSLHYKKATPLYSENDVKATNSYKTNGIEILRKYKEGFEECTSNNIESVFIDITSIVNSDESMTYKKFVDDCTEIKKLIKQQTRSQKNLVPVLYYDNNPDYLKNFNAFAVHFQYFYKVQSVLYGEAEDYIQDLTEMYYNETEMLIEDRIKYILNFPTYTYRFNDPTDSYFLALARRCEGRVSICPIDDMRAENIKKINNFNFAKNNVVPLNSLYPLYKNKDMIDNNITFTHLDTISNYRKVSNLFVDFENILNLEGMCLDISNTCFVNYDNKVHICYVEELKALVKGFRYLEDMQFGDLDFSCKEMSLYTRDIGKYTPIDTFADAHRYRTILNNKLKCALEKNQKNSDNGKFTFTAKRALTLSSKLAIPIKKFFTSSVANGGIDLFNSDELLEFFHELGLHYADIFRFRLNGISAILNVAPRRSFRNNSYMTVSINLNANEDVSRLLKDNPGVKLDEFYNDNNEVYKKVITFNHFPIVGIYGGIHTCVDSSENNRIVVTEKFLARESI